MNRSLDQIAGVASVVGFIFTVGYTIVALQGDAAIEVLPVLLMLAFINIGLGAICILQARSARALGELMSDKKAEIQSLKHELVVAQKRYEDVKNSYTRATDLAHSVQDQLRDRLFETYDALKRLLNGANFDEINVMGHAREHDMYYLFLVNNVKSMFDSITNDECAVCIKFLDLVRVPLEEEGEVHRELTLRTFMRDSESYVSRKSTAGGMSTYPYYENTAFKVILSPDDPRTYYVCDNLQKEQFYVNSNPDWESLYNATLVCPIQMQMVGLDDDADEMVYSVLGFICVDNMKGGLNSPAAVSLLAAIADSLYVHMHVWGDMKAVYKEKELAA